MSIVRKLFGSANERFVKGLDSDVVAINALEPEMAKLTDSQLQAKTNEFRARLQKGETVEDLQNEAFAVVREAAKRVLGQRHYDVQLLGGMVLNRGMITEMKTGEGKTLVSTLAAYLNALPGNGVHIVTVNDYLARRDAEWMGRVYNYLGLSTGVILNNMRDDERKIAYSADITYATNNELGFDYLRDNMKFHREDMVQRPFAYAIVDEVDSILIDEARTPLIISGPVEDNTDLYVKLDKVIPRLAPTDYEKEEKHRSVNFTEEGTNNLEKLLHADGLLAQGSNLYDLENITLVHHANQALRARTLFEIDKDYIVKDNKVIIIDEFTGRMMDGRRYSEGLHQALEAKEGVKIQQENQTLASITFQNYFRLYPKLAGMTGTAMTEASEFEDIYKLKVTEIPTHRPVQREDDDDVIYRTVEEKFAAIIEVIKECSAKKQPMLIGTASIEKSELLSRMLKAAKIKHNVLNARYHEQEAFIISQAGQPGAVTVATNMAGRGTDIQLGGNAEMLIHERTKEITDEAEKKKIAAQITEQVKRDAEIVKQAGGLCVIGSERHESRRIDNQLRGRSGRQGDPGRSMFFLSAQDDLIRIFGADKKMDWIMGTMGEPGEPITHPLITKMMEKSQQKVEARNYDMRKNLLKFDDVMNDQRKVVFEQRIELMDAQDADAILMEMALDVISDQVAIAIPEKAYPEEWDTEGLTLEMHRIFGLQLPVAAWAKEEGIAENEIKTRIEDAVNKLLAQKTTLYGQELIKDIARKLLLFTLDDLWKDHLLSLDHLRQGINLRAYAQKDPLNEYKREAFLLFESMLSRLREISVSRFAHMEVRAPEESLNALERQHTQKPMRQSRMDPALITKAEAAGLDVARGHVPPSQRNPRDPSTWGKIGRNETCPCGSGKKFKQCHGTIEG